MRVILFSWEYPPRVVGQLAEYVRLLATTLVKSRLEVHVVTYHDVLTGAIEEPDGVKVFRVTNPVRTHVGILTWALTLNQEVERAAANIYYQVSKQVDLVNVHDWHFIPAAVTLKNAFGIPFIYSVESLEDHRAPLANTPYSMSIKSIEWLGFYEAQRVCVKSEWMRGEVIRIHAVPKKKITVVNLNASDWIKDVLALYKSAIGGMHN